MGTLYYRICRRHLKRDAGQHNTYQKILWFSILCLSKTRQVILYFPQGFRMHWKMGFTKVFVVSEAHVHYRVCLNVYESVCTIIFLSCICYAKHFFLA